MWNIKIAKGAISAYNLNRSPTRDSLLRVDLKEVILGWP
jgi:hypothetical protein